MWNKVVSFLKRVTLITYFERRQKQKAWDRFVQENKKKIASLPINNGRQSVPAIWHPNLKQWIWVDRKTRRRADMQLRRIGG